MKKTRIGRTKLKKEIFKKVKDYYNLFHKQKRVVPGVDYINYGGRVYNEEEMINIVDSALDFWLTSGKYCSEFEKRLARFLKIKYCTLTNSGSSANLLAFMALTSHKLGERRIKPGDEVITVAASFPTTVTPVIQYGAIPVFVDVQLPSYNIDCSLLEKAVSGKTKAVMLAHTLGNPFNIKKVKKFCGKYGLWLIEDNCDALGSRYFYKKKWIYTGTIGDIGTSSFYPPHHMTMGEGGAVYTNDSLLKRIIDSLRDWGRDCWCQSGKDNTCGRRFTGKFGQLPLGYDHKYVYSHFGYNLRATEMQAAVGVAQLGKLPHFVKARKKNWRFLREKLEEYSKYFILPEPERNSDPSWFGFLLTVKEKAGFSRNDIVKYLEANKIQTRMLFAGNLIKHPCFNEMRKTGKKFKVVGKGRKLPITDSITNNTFWIGVYPGMTKEMLDYIINSFELFFQKL